MRQKVITILVLGLLVMFTGCDRIGEILNSYPGLTLYFEQASDGKPFANVHATDIEFSSAAVSGTDGRVTLRVPQQAEKMRVHVEWTTLVPYQARSKDFEFRLGKGDNYYRVILQDDPRQPY